MQDSSVRPGIGAIEDAPVVSYVQQLFEKAVALKASDLHFEPYEHRYRVRMRIDGGIQPRSKLSFTKNRMPRNIASPQPNHASISQPPMTCRMSSGGSICPVAMNTTLSTISEIVAPAPSSSNREK